MPTELTMPELGEGVIEGTISKWLKQEGDSINEYDPILEVSTDKVDTEVPSPADGVLLKIMVSEGETVGVGTPLCLIGQPGEATDSPPAQPQAKAPPPPSSGNGQSQAVPPTPAPPQRRKGRGPHITPVVARIAAEHNINVSQLTGSGTGGRVTKKDILAYIEQQKTAPVTPTYTAPLPAQAPAPVSTPAPAVIAPPPPPPPVPQPVHPPASASLSAGEIIPFAGMRKAIADHMVLSKKTSPHVTTVMEVDCSNMVSYYYQNKADFLRQAGIKLTFTPFFVASVVAGLKTVPLVNSVLTQRGIELQTQINIGVAVALDDGLIVPVIKQADNYNLTGLQRAVTDLATRARTKKLAPADVQGGTFTISNHGVSGSLFATPIINQPQVGILGVGKIEKRVVVVSEHGVDTIAIKPMCYLSFTFDHRILDGASADKFLGTVKQNIEQWR